MALDMEVGLSPGHFVLDGDPAPCPKKGAEHSSQFSAHFYCGQMARCSKMPLGTDIGLSPGDFVLDGNAAPTPQKGGGAPQFSTHVYCGQTAAWIKMPLGTEVDLGPDDIVLDGNPCLLYTSPSPRDRQKSRMPSSA